jgi:hypothetical protein
MELLQKNYVTIFIASRNRPIFSLLALNSAINQTYQRKKILFSDNSTNLDTKFLIEKNFSKNTNLFSYKKRDNLTSTEHFKILLKEVDTEFVVFFHDDDILDPEYLNTAFEIFAEHNDVSAIGFNAKLINEKNEFLRNLNSKYFMKDIKISKKSIYYNYFYNRNLIKPLPFPSYIYKTRVLKNPVGQNKHDDVNFVAQCLDEGNIFWSKEIKISYRIHRTQDSSNESIIQRIEQVRNIQLDSSLSVDEKKLFKAHIRFTFWKIYFSRKSKDFFKKRYSKARNFILFELFKLIFFKPKFLLSRIFIFFVKD